LLALSSILSIARTSGILSSMNADLIAREAHMLLHEVAAYEEPRLSFEDSPSLSMLAKGAGVQDTFRPRAEHAPAARRPSESPIATKGHIKDTDSPVKDRRETIVSVIRNKGTASIKDISTLVRGVSEKTIQRELIALIGLGMVGKQGERRWSTYTLL